MKSIPSPSKEPNDAALMLAREPFSPTTSYLDHHEHAAQT